MPFTKIVLTSSFEKAYRRFTENNVTLKKKVEQALKLLQGDIYTPSLKTHKLGGKFYGSYACSCGYDCRMIFTVERDEKNIEYILLHDIGTHDEVY